MFEWFKEPKPTLQKVVKLVPVVWILVKTFFRIMTPEGIGIALLMSIADVLSFLFLIVLFIYLLVQLGPNPRGINWKLLIFYTCISFIPLVIADVVLPLALEATYAQFANLGGSYSFDTLQLAAGNFIFQLTAFGPYIWSAICTVAFFPPFIYGIRASLKMKWHLVIPFAITVAVISWVLGSVIAGIPFGGLKGA